MPGPRTAVVPQPGLEHRKSRIVAGSGHLAREGYEEKVPALLRRWPGRVSGATPGWTPPRLGRPQTAALISHGAERLSCGHLQPQ